MLGLACHVDTVSHLWALRSEEHRDLLIAHLSRNGVRYVATAFEHVGQILLAHSELFSDRLLRPFDFDAAAQSGQDGVMRKVALHAFTSPNAAFHSLHAPSICTLP